MNLKHILMRGTPLELCRSAVHSVLAFIFVFFIFMFLRTRQIQAILDFCKFYKFFWLLQRNIYKLVCENTSMETGGGRVVCAEMERRIQDYF